MRWLTFLLLLLFAFASSAHAQKLVVFGDSISAGAAATRQSNTYVDRLSHRINKNWRTFNYSRGGWAVAGSIGFVHPAFIDGALHLFPSVVLIALGTNDFAVSVPLDTFTTSYQLIVERFANFFGVGQVFCLTPIYSKNGATPNAVGATLADYREVIATECSAAGGIVLDGLEAMPTSDAFLADQTHPNDRGHRAMARWLHRALRPYLY